MYGFFSDMDERKRERIFWYSLDTTAMVSENIMILARKIQLITITQI